MYTEYWDKLKQDSEGYAKGYAKGKEEGKIEGFNLGIQESEKTSSEKEKVVKISIDGIPSNKKNECKSYLEELLKKISLSVESFSDYAREDSLNLKIVSLLPLVNIRKSIVESFPINISHIKTEVNESYKAISAIGTTSFKTIVKGEATKGAIIIFEDDINQTPIRVGSDGKYEAEITIKVTAKIIDTGYLIGIATKDGLKQKVEAQIQN